MSLSERRGGRSGGTGNTRDPRYGVGRRFFNAGLGAVLGRLLVVVAAVAAPTVPSTAWGNTVRILALGDSLIAGFGLADDEGFTRQLQQALRAKGYAVEVMNAGVSGDTTAGGLARLDWALADRPDLAVVALGANDMLRGVDPAASRANLDRILARLKAEKVPALLVGMVAAPNLGRAYADAFNAIYPDLADKYGLPLYPFFLNGVAGQPGLNQGDGIHPNARGVAAVVQGILPYVTGLIDMYNASPGSTVPGASGGVSGAAGRGRAPS